MSSTPTLIEIAPGLFRVRKDAPEPPKSSLPMPNVISDTMPPTEQVNGKFYESKSAFRRVGRSLGLTEVGTAKLPPKKRILPTSAERRASVQKAFAEYRQGRRARKG